MNLTNTKTMPEAEHAEKSVLSVLLRHSDAYINRAKGEGLIPEMFHNAACSKLLTVIYDLHDKGVDVEDVSVMEYLHDQDELDRVGGPEGLMAIRGAAQNFQHWDEHSKIVRDRYARRGLIRAAEAVVDSAQNDSAEEAQRIMREAIDAAQVATAQDRVFYTMLEAMDRFGERIVNVRNGTSPAQPTGITQIDEINGGMRPGELWIACGATSSGKSALAYQMSIPALDAGKKVLIYTLEMTVDEVIARLFACRGRIDIGDILSADGVSPQTVQKLKLQKSGLEKAEIRICDKPNLSIDYVCAHAEMEQGLGDVGLVIVDYIQLLEGGRKSSDTQEQELALYSRRLKQLAKKLDCPVISPAQINDDGHLRGSRAIGMDADVLLKIKSDGISVDKYRNGPRNTLLPLGLVGQYQRFETMAFKSQNQYGR